MQIFSTELLALLNGIIIVGVGWLLRRVGKTNDTLNQINGSVRELKQWTLGHERLDDERYERTQDVHKDIWNKLNAKK